MLMKLRKRIKKEGPLEEVFLNKNDENFKLYQLFVKHNKKQWVTGGFDPQVFNDYDGLEPFINIIETKKSDNIPKSILKKDNENVKLKKKVNIQEGNNVKIEYIKKNE